MALLLLTLGAGATARAASEPALVVEEGSLVRRQVVALGRDLVVAGEAGSDVAVVNGSVRITGSVEGDVIVLGGDARFGPSSRVGGDVFVLGGRIEAAAGARLDGRTAAYPSVSSAWIVLLGGPSFGHPATSRVVLGAKLALVAAWLGWSVFLFAASGREVLHTSEVVAAEPFRCFVIGLAGVFAAFLTAIFLSALAAAVVGVPLLALVVLLALLFKLWGMVGVFHALGRWLAGRLSRRRLIPLNAAIVGLTLLGGLKLVPYLGSWVWTLATFIGVGATLLSKFGRREPWFETGAPSGLPSRV